MCPFESPIRQFDTERTEKPQTTLIDMTSAFRIEDESHIGFWDALIISSAPKTGASQILSEDLNSGQRISGIQIVNPFVGHGRKPECR